MALNSIEKIANALHLPAAHKPTFDKEKVTDIRARRSWHRCVFLGLFVPPLFCHTDSYFMQEKERSAAFS